MTRDDLMPVRTVLAPPDDLEEAVERVSNLADGRSMLGLVGATFADIDQLTKSLKECKVKGDFELLCDSGPVQTWRGAFFDHHGNSFEILANSWSKRLCQVINVRFATADVSADVATVRTIRKVLLRKDETP